MFMVIFLTDQEHSPQNWKTEKNGKRINCLIESSWKCLWMFWGQLTVYGLHHWQILTFYTRAGVLHSSNSYPTDMKSFHQSLNFVYFAYHMTDLLNFNSYFNHISTSVNSVGESISRQERILAVSQPKKLK